MNRRKEGTPLRIRCLDCGVEWDPDMEPVACECSSGGRWQLKVGDAPWVDSS